MQLKSPLRSRIFLADHHNSRTRLSGHGALGSSAQTRRPLPSSPAQVDAIVEKSPTAPLTLTFEAGCGRVLFTSYHTHQHEGEAPSRWLNAQEMILGYLAFEIGTCVEDPILI